jgi:hypothetical protein
MMARPTKLTETLHEQIVQLVRAGVFLKRAAAFCQLDERTLYRWIERGEEEESRIDSGIEPDSNEKLYMEFCQSIRQAIAYSDVMDLNVISQAAANDPHWAERRLKLRHPEWFRQESKLEVSGQLDNTQRLEVQAAYDPETLALSHRLMKRLQGGDDEPRAIESGTE